MWLLLLALPVQSHAASRMLFCEPARHAQASVEQQTVVETDHAGHAGPVSFDDAHAGHHGADRSDDADISAPSVTHSKCSACASCCLGMALVPAVLIFSSGPHAPELVPAAAPTFQVHTPRRLDRPPRPRLA